MSHSSSLLIQSAAGLESLGYMTWKILQLFYINIFMQSNLMTVPKSVSSDSASNDDTNRFQDNFGCSASLCAT